MPESALVTVGRWTAQEVALGIESGGSVSIPALTNLITERLVSEPKLLRSYLKESLRSIIYDAVQRKVARSRTHILFQEEVIARNELQAKMPSRPRWGAWLEHVGDRHVLLMQMTRADLEAAAQEREARGGFEYRTAALWRKIGSDLRPGQQVRDVFSEQRIAALAESLQITVSVATSESGPTSLAAD